MPWGAGWGEGEQEVKQGEQWILALEQLWDRGVLYLVGSRLQATLLEHLLSQTGFPSWQPGNL